METQVRSAPPVRRQRIAGIVLVALLLLVAGFLLGQRSSWGTKHPEVKSGIAMKANDDNSLIMFDADDGTQADLSADDIWWESGEGRGGSNPPCLRTALEKARVDVGLMKIARPEGGWFTKVVWIRCL